MTIAELLQEQALVPVKKITPPPAVSEGLWSAEESVEQKYAALASITVAQYVKWLKKNVRLYGRSGVFGNGYETGVEVFVRETIGLEIGFLAGGEVEIDHHVFLTGWTDVAYYTYENDTNEFVCTFGKALKYAEWQADAPFIVNWNFR